MNIVVSYTRQDQPRVDSLVAGLRQLGHHPWYDRGLHSGEDWWREILSKIVSADAVLLAISPTFLNSHACTAERRFRRRRATTTAGGDGGPGGARRAPG